MPTNRLDTQTEQTASVGSTWLATRHLLSREMKLCCLVNRPFMTHTPYTPTDGHPPSVTPPVKQIFRIQSAAEIVGEGEGEWPVVNNSV